MQNIISKKSIGERLRALRLEKDLSQADVSETLGLSRSHYSQVELGKQFPSYGVLSRIAEFYDKDYEWILHGQDVNKIISNVKLVLDGEKGSGSASSPVQTINMLASRPEVYGAGRTVLLALTEQYAYLENRNNEVYINELPEFSLPVAQLSNGVYRAFEVEGDSMENTLQYQDIAIGSMVDDFSKVSLTGIYIVVLDHSIRIRRVAGYQPESASFTCISDNKRYRPETIRLNDIREMWEVKAKVSFKLNQTMQSIAQYFQDFESTIAELKDEMLKLKGHSF